jgi:hypothetical protein
MSYIKTSWVARVGTALNRFLKTNESSGSVELTNDPTGVSVQGTPFTVANMNKIETGIYDAHVLIDNHKLNDGSDHSFIDQDVTTEATPNFAGLQLLGKLLKFNPTATILSSFNNGGITGITFDGTNLIICKSTGTPSIYINDGVSATILSSFASPGVGPRCLTFDGTNLISYDSLTNLIYIHSGITSTISSSFAAPASNLSGLTFDGTNLISCDQVTGLVYIHDGISPTILSSFASPGTVPSGLAFEGTNLISCDSNTDKIYIHNGKTATILSSFSSPGLIPRYLAFTGTNLISCDESAIKTYVHESAIYI